jgi:transcriptional regulator with XRE-family HTH domain
MDTSTMTPVSLRLRELREAQQLSQSELARRSGVRQSTISRLESGELTTIKLATLEHLANALKVDAALLIQHQRRRK